MSDKTETVPLIVEVIAPAGVDSIAGISITQPLQFSRRASNIEVGVESRVNTRLDAEPITTDRCLPPPVPDPEAEPGSTSVRVTFLPRTRLLGLADTARAASSTTRRLDDVEMSSSLVPGRYDFYVEPLAYEDECSRPPELFLDQEVLAGDVSLKIALGAPERYDAVVRFPSAAGDLDGWHLDLVDGESGFVVSSGVDLKEPRSKDGTLEYDASVVFSPVHGRSGSVVEMVRLTPPKGLTAPTLLVARPVTELFQSEPAVVDQLTAVPKPVEITGRVVAAGSLDGVEAGLTFVLESLSGLTEGTTVSFSREVRAAGDGTFRASLLPGNYRVVTQPASGLLAQSEVKFSVSASDAEQTGRTIEIASRRSIQGRLFDFRGAPVRGAQVDLIPPPERLRGGGLALSAASVRFVPSGLPGETSDDGTFRLLADAGQFNVIARSVSLETDFTWALRLGVTVGDGDVVLGDVSEGAPLLFHGTVLSEQTTPVPSALIRAYAYVKGGEISASVASADYVLLVAEARANSEGEYQLLLPAEVALNSQ